MPTVFSHIVQKRLSQESENVATTALAFILESGNATRTGMMKLLRGLVPEMPDLWFRTQQTEGNSRPDMWGNNAEAKPHVFIENKFWAGLTDKQPVDYLRILAEQNHPTVLLVVVPEARERTVWRELSQRLENNGITSTDREPSVGILRMATTSRGPILALTSWAKLLRFLEVETTDDIAARNGNLLQLRALCEQEDNDAFVPFSAEEMSDQRIPSLVLQLTDVVTEATLLAFKEGVLIKGKKLKVSANSFRIGTYASIFPDERCGLWFGVHFGLWKKHGATPLWGVFSASNWGRASEVRALLEPWAVKNSMTVASEPTGHFVVAFNVLRGNEKDQVIRGIVDRLKEIGGVLSVLKPKVAEDSELIGNSSEDLNDE